jgi:hypothetical protein
VAEAETKIRYVAKAWEREEMTGWPLYLVWYYARASQLDEAIAWTERAFQRTPAGYGGPGFPTGELDTVLDLEGGRFRGVVARLRHQAWERVLAEAKKMAIP